MQKILIALGIFLLLAGVLWPLLSKIPLGRLPGDILINKPGLKIFIPVTTSIVVSIVLTILFWIFRK